MKLEVLVYPNKKLFVKSEPVTRFDAELGAFLDDMYETMIAEGGIGLAAIQVGRAIRAFIINLVGEDGEQHADERIELINPVFVEHTGEQVFQEGCLSVPGYYEDVTRAREVVVEFCDRHGQPQRLRADGLLAVALQHENDHLDGHLFIEKIAYNKRKQFNKEFKKNGFKLRKKPRTAAKNADGTDTTD